MWILPNRKSILKPELSLYVNKNQVLFVINQDQYRAKADKARAQLKKDEAQALKAERDLKRIRPLFEQNAASQLDLDNAEAAYESAEATVAMSEADLAQAELELGYTIVRSPLSGHISERNVDLGTLVGPGDFAHIILSVLLRVLHKFGVYPHVSNQILPAVHHDSNEGEDHNAIRYG